LPEHISNGITTIESIELQRQELIQKKQSLINQISELNKKTEVPHEQLIEQINELKVELEEKDNFVKRIKESCRSGEKNITS
jgi:hypothetical protein